MKRPLLNLLASFFTITALVLCNLSSAQQQHQIWGMTSGGGQYGIGVIFKTDSSGAHETVVQNFLQCTGADPDLTSLLQAADGKLYGMTKLGGTNNKGVIFQYDTTTGAYLTLFNFDGAAHGSTPLGSLIQATDGKLYGMTNSGGTHNDGVLFQFDPSTHIATKKIDFDGAAHGSAPSGALLQAVDGKLYGMTNSGGIHNRGVIFQYTLSTNTLTKKIDFDGTAHGSNPYGSLIQAANGKLYGMTNTGGSYDDGVIFQYNSTSNTCTKEYNFDGSIHGSNPFGSLMETSNGILYGMASNGGANNAGVLFRFDHNTNSYTKVFDFISAANGGTPYGSLIEATDGKLYGLTESGGANNTGVIFQFDTTTEAYVKKFDFDNLTTGANPGGTLLQAADGKMYGITELGGANNVGAAFQFNPSSGSFIKKFDFNSTPNGSTPYGSLMQATDGELYGMTKIGGANNMGVLFQLDTATNILTKKFDFDSLSGYNPRGALIQATDGKLYGMTNLGGTKNFGTLFQYDPVTNTFIKKNDFDSTTTGSYPYGSLVQATDGNLYGMASSGGVNNLGVIFQYNPSNDTIIKKYDFDGAAHGMAPFGSFVQATDGNLYGMTNSGGANSAGIIFQYNPSTDTFTKKYDFDGTAHGSEPYGSLTQATDGKLYGMTSTGGSHNDGVLFQYDFSSNTFAKKIDFDGTSHGANPWGTLLQASDGNLYGVTRGGGTADWGVLFKYNFTANTCTKNIDFTGANGENPVYANLIEIISPITTGITENTLADDNTITIYPNPSSGKFTIAANELPYLLHSTLSIYNTVGQQVYQSAINDTKSEIDLSSQSAGLYFVTIKTTKGTLSKRIIISQ